MKHLIISFVSSFFLLIFIWLVIGYSRYGDLVLDKHLDFYSMISRLDTLELSVFDFIDQFEQFIKTLDFGGNFFESVLALILKPLQIVLELLRSICLVIYNIFLFVFNPIFF